MALSMDLRIRIVSAYRAGEGSARQLAKRFSVGHATVGRLLKRLRETGTISPKHGRRGPLPIVQTDDFDRISGWIKVEPDLTQSDLAERFTDETGQAVDRRTMGRALRRMHITRKKRR